MGNEMPKPSVVPSGPQNPFPAYNLPIVPEEYLGLPLTELAEHARVTPEEVREALIRLVNSIPDEDLKNCYGAQLTMVT